MHLSQSHLEYPIINNDWSLDILKLLDWLQKVDQKLQPDKKIHKKITNWKLRLYQKRNQGAIEQISNKIGQKGSWQLTMYSKGDLIPNLHMRIFVHCTTIAVYSVALIKILLEDEK